MTEGGNNDRQAAENPGCQTDPRPPLIYIAAIAISIVLGLLYPLPWIGDLLRRHSVRRRLGGAVRRRQRSGSPPSAP